MLRCKADSQQFFEYINVVSSIMRSTALNNIRFDVEISIPSLFAITSSSRTSANLGSMRRGGGEGRTPVVSFGRAAGGLRRGPVCCWNSCWHRFQNNHRFCWPDAAREVLCNTETSWRGLSKFVTHFRSPLEQRSTSVVGLCKKWKMLISTKAGSSCEIGMLNWKTNVVCGKTILIIILLNSYSSEFGQRKPLRLVDKIQ